MDATNRLALEEIGQIAIPVGDIDRATAFYRDVLGMRFLFSAPPGLSFFDCAGVRLMLDLPAKENAGNGSVLYFKVADLNGAFESLKTQGVPIEAVPHRIANMPDYELWMCFFRDPDNNLLALMSEKR
jgi:methylmalonyl-CoA/ethylmalonyl-CoA epimerase